MKTEKIKKVGGSVLFTVVAVMTLLVVFMAGTMILVASANHRSHINYSTAQTTVTSRTVAESVINAIQSGNKDYTDYFFTISDKNPRIEIPVSINQSTDTAELGTLGKIDNVVVTYEGKMNFYSSGKDEDNGSEAGWMPRDVIKVLSTVNLGRASSSTAIYLVVDPPNSDPGGNGDGAGFVTTGGTELNCQVSLYGGAYINIPKLSDAEHYNYDGTDDSYLSPYKMTLQNEGGIAEADTVVNGSVHIENYNGFVFPGPSKGVTIWGDLSFNNNFFSLTANNYDNWPSKLNFNEIPYIYVDGRISSGNYITFANSGGQIFPLNVFCGAISAKGNGFNSVADIYCLDEWNGTNGTEDEKGLSVVSASSSKLASWTHDVINKTNSFEGSYVAGKFFTNGSLRVEGNSSFTVDGDVRIKKDLFLNIPDGYSFTVNGDLVVGGAIHDLNGNSLNRLNVSGKLYYDGDVPGAETTLVEGVEIVEEADTDNYTKVNNKENCTWKAINLKSFKLDGDAEFEGLNGKFTIDQPDETINSYVITLQDALDNVLDMKAITTDDEYIYIAKDLNAVYFLYGGDQVPVGDSTSAIKDCYETATYYGETDKTGTKVIGKEPVYEDSWYYLSTDLLNPDPYRYKEEEIMVTHYYKDGSRITAGEAYSKKSGTFNLNSIADFGGKEKIYPAYAQKLVLLGDRQLENPTTHELIPVKETQVIKSMEDILKDVINPYKSEGAPPQYPEKEFTDGTYKTYSTVMDIFNDCGTYLDDKMSSSITSANYIKVGKNDAGEYQIGEGAGAKKVTNVSDIPGTVVINKSCTLNNLWVQSNLPGSSHDEAIVVSPTSGDIYINIEGKVGGGNGFKFIIDDVTTENKVYFFLKKGSKLSMASSGSGMYTQRYKELYDSGQTFQIATNESYLIDDEDIPTIQDLGYTAPNLYIYAEKLSDAERTASINKIAEKKAENPWYVDYMSINMDMPIFYLQNYGTVFAGNIISPDIYVNFSSTDNAKTTDIYYNGQDIGAYDSGGYYMMFGCCNSRQTDFPNKMKVLYVPDSGGDDTTIETLDRSHWLKVLYYDEY